MIGATQDITVRKAAEFKLLENERSEIAQELHDNLNQILGAAKLYIEMAKTDDENREMCLDKSSAFIMEVINEIRKISKTLSTPGISWKGYDCIKTR